MFGPNDRRVCECHSANYRGLTSHRGRPFEKLMEEIVERVHSRLHVPWSFTVLILPVGGTLAVQAMVRSHREPIRVMPSRGTFGNRLRASVVLEKKLAGRDDFEIPFADVQYETSVSSVMTSGATLLDMVSGFPYYAIPDRTLCAVTTAGKQLGALPGLSLAFVSDWGPFVTEPYTGRLVWDGLDLFTHRRFFPQLPTTPPISLLVDLNERLARFDPLAHIIEIRRRREKLRDALPPSSVIGTGPVVTIDPAAVRISQRAILDEFDLWRTELGYRQVFLWSGTDAQHERLRKALKRAKGGKR